MDPIDEFEFKPLTDGLGFHKKAIKLNEKVISSGLLNEELKSKLPPLPPADLVHTQSSLTSNTTYEDLMESLKPNLDLKITETLPRDNSDLKKSAMDLNLPIAPHIPNINFDPTPEEDKNTFDKAKASAAGTRRGAADSPVSMWTASSISFQAFMLDAFVVLGLTLVFIVNLLLVTKIELLTVVRNVSIDGTLKISLAILYLAVSQIYVILARSFYGRTLGEWTFDYQMGSNETQERSVYPLLVVWRSLVVMLTGIITLPLLSLLSRTDIAAQITGLQTYRKK